MNTCNNWDGNSPHYMLIFKIMNEFVLFFIFIFILMTVTDGGKCGQAYGLGVMGLKMEEVLKERGVESLPFGGKRLLTETNGERIESFVQRLVASGSGTGKTSLPPSPCKDSAVSPLANGR